MKQHITKKQWDAIKFDKITFLNALELSIHIDNREDIILAGSKIVENFRPTIGQMIEFLGDKLCRMKHEIYNDDEYKLQMEIFNSKWTWIVMMYERTFLKEELCDALWEAVKYKLKQ